MSRLDPAGGGPWSSRRQPSTPVLLRGYLLIGSLLLTGFALFYTNRVVRRLQEQTTTLSSVMAGLMALSTAQVATHDDSLLMRSLGLVAKPITFPFIITDGLGRPRAWNSLTGLDPRTVSDEELDRADLRSPGPQVGFLLRRVQEYDRKSDPVPLRVPGGEGPVGYFHYGPTAIENEIRWVPWVLLGSAAVFAAIGIMWYRSLRRSEQNLIWAGMAKETAHQLGTPISSLMGWMELVKDQARRGSQGMTEIPTPLFDEVDREVQQDLERLKKVASRFGHIGSLPSLASMDIVPIVAGTVGYYRRRLPQQGIRVAIDEHFDPEVPPVHVNAELMGWVIENLIKNAIDASDTRTGRIEVSVRRRRESETVEILVKDNGRGIPPSDQKRIFDPGFSTKKRGWGLGLTLARRIVEEYHGGRLDLRNSVPGKGSEFAVVFPV